MIELQDYLYISRAKVELIFPQIPKGFIDGIKAELEAKLGPLTAKLSGTESPPSDWIERFLLVKRYIESHYDLGTIVYPGEWVKDTVRVRCVSFSKQFDHHFSEDSKNLYWLAGETGEGSPTEPAITFGLIGSRIHVLSSPSDTPNKVRLSYLPDIVYLLQRSLAWDSDEYALPEVQARRLALSDSISHPALGVERRELAHAVRRVAETADGIDFDIELLARPIFEERVDDYGRPMADGKMTRLFTPLYVATRGWQ